jgi:alkylhydroperoxidase family enzyme
MARVSILKSPDELTGEPRRIAERIVDTRKSLEGPFSVWMHAPEWAERVAHLGTLVRWAGTLELRLRTLAALVVGPSLSGPICVGASRV